MTKASNSEEQPIQQPTKDDPVRQARVMRILDEALERANKVDTGEPPLLDPTKPSRDKR